MPVHQRRLKVIQFAVGTPPINYECQISTWTLANNTDDGDRLYTFCPDGEFIEEVDPDYAIELTFFSDWRVDGISDFLEAHDGETVAFEIVHHPDTPAEQVQWTGQCVIKSPNAGGDARTTESQEVTLRCIGRPVYGRAA